MTVTLRLWVSSPLVAQAAGLCAAEPAAPLEKDRVSGRKEKGGKRTEVGTDG